MLIATDLTTTKHCYHRPFGNPLLQALFEPFFIAVYNLFYTSQPVLFLGVFDQDVRASAGLKYPRLYTPGRRSRFFNKKEFFKSAVQGFVTSCVLFFAAHGRKEMLSPCANKNA